MLRQLLHVPDVVNGLLMRRSVLVIDSNIP